MANTLQFTNALMQKTSLPDVSGVVLGIAVGVVVPAEKQSYCFCSEHI